METFKIPKDLLTTRLVFGTGLGTLVFSVYTHTPSMETFMQENAQSPYSFIEPTRSYHLRHEEVMLEAEAEDLLLFRIKFGC